MLADSSKRAHAAHHYEREIHSQLMLTAVAHSRGEAFYRNLQLLNPEEREDFKWVLSEYHALQQHLQDPYDVGFHSNNRNVTYRIWQLLPEQRKDLYVSFSYRKQEDRKAPCPPFRARRTFFESTRRTQSPRRATTGTSGSGKPWVIMMRRTQASLSWR